MGISGLIPFLEKASSKVHLKNLRGCTVAVDTYCWLHRGVFGCAEKLVRGEDTDQYINYCLKYVQMLLSYDIKPILVFDGQHLPAKALTETRRRESRQESKKRATELMRLGRFREARSHVQRCVDVTHEMALRLIRECRQRNVDCIVAPYEADAQMAWLNKTNLAHYVITEDSDLMLFGAQNVIFKLDLTGAGLLVQANKLHLAMGCCEDRFTFEKFRRMCILSGCDYLDSLPGIGLMKACKFILKTEQEDMWLALKKIPQYLNMRQLEVTDEYIEGFLKAEATFKYMYIYNPIKRKMERLNELQDCEIDGRYCGNAGTALSDDEQALHLALGNLNPFTLKPLDFWHPDEAVSHVSTRKDNIKRAKHKSIWQVNFQAHSVNGVESRSSCALDYKKVDFISKTLNEEISAKILEENAKPEEAEIFSLYQHQAAAEAESDNCEPQWKRRRCDSGGSSKSSQQHDSSPTSPVVGKKHQNPFMCVQQPTVKSTIICENSSLLKTLSPKKCREVVMQRTTPVNGLRRNIFASEQVMRKEVKSRFFATNIRQAAQNSTPLTKNHDSDVTTEENIKTEIVLATTDAKDDEENKKVLKVNEREIDESVDMAEEMLKIETLSQQQQNNQAQLYSPSPKKDSKIKQTNEASNVDNSSDKEIDSMSDKGATIDVSLDEKADNIDAIFISDDDDDEVTNSGESTSTNNTLQFTIHRARRLGLCKPKVTKSSRKTGSTTKSAKSTANIPVLSKNQTRLSMFGFQKRSVLK